MLEQKVLWYKKKTRMEGRVAKKKKQKIQTNKKPTAKKKVAMKINMVFYILPVVCGVVYLQICTPTNIIIRIRSYSNFACLFFVIWHFIFHLLFPSRICFPRLPRLSHRLSLIV